MAATVELNVRTKLGQVAQDLEAIAGASKRAQEETASFGRDIGEEHGKAIKRTETYLGRLRGLGGRVFDGMKADFRAMMSTVGVSEGLKLGSTFRDSVRETFELSDTIRKLASVFGLAEGRFAGFQTRLTRGLGDIGLGADAAINALKGLAETQVRGEEELEAYAKVSGQLAATTGTRGQEGTIGRGIARVITAQGGDPNNLSDMRRVADDLRRAYNATGQIPSAILQALETVVANMPSDLRKSIGTSGLIELGAVSATAGPGATKFLEEYLSKSPIARKALEARGFKGVFGPEGFNTEKFRQAAGGVMSTFPGDPRLMAQTLGLSEDAAEGFVRLYESLDRVAAAQAKMANDTRSLEDQYRSSMGASEAFRASLNKVKSSLAEPLTAVTDTITRGLRAAFEFSLSDLTKLLPEGLRKRIEPYQDSVPEALGKNLGATATVAGAGLLVSTLTGGGLRNLLNLGKGKAIGTAERMAFEEVTGRAVQDVYVVNAAEIAQGGGGVTAALGKMTGVVGLLAKAGLVGAAGVGGYAVGGLINDAIKGTELSEAIDRLLEPAFRALTGTGAQTAEQPSFSAPPVATGAAPDVLGRVPQIVTPEGQRMPMGSRPGQQKVDVRVDINVDTKNRDLKATPKLSRGGSQ
jgi:hypothetical protein